MKQKFNSNQQSNNDKIVTYNLQSKKDIKYTNCIIILRCAMQLC